MYKIQIQFHESLGAGNIESEMKWQTPDSRTGTIHCLSFEINCKLKEKPTKNEVWQ